MFQASIWTTSVKGSSGAPFRDAPGLPGLLVLLPPLNLALFPGLSGHPGQRGRRQRQAGQTLQDRLRVGGGHLRVEQRGRLLEGRGLSALDPQKQVRRAKPSLTLLAPAERPRQLDRPTARVHRHFHFHAPGQLVPQRAPGPRLIRLPLGGLLQRRAGRLIQGPQQPFLQVPEVLSRIIHKLPGHPLQASDHFPHPQAQFIKWKRPGRLRGGGYILHSPSHLSSFHAKGAPKLSQNHE